MTQFLFFQSEETIQLKIMQSRLHQMFRATMNCLYNLNNPNIRQRQQKLQFQLENYRDFVQEKQEQYQNGKFKKFRQKLNEIQENHLKQFLKYKKAQKLPIPPEILTKFGNILKGKSVQFSNNFNDPYDPILHQNTVNNFVQYRQNQMEEENQIKSGKRMVEKKFQQHAFNKQQTKFKLIIIFNGHKNFFPLLTHYQPFEFQSYVKSLIQEIFDNNVGQVMQLIYRKLNILGKSRIIRVNQHITIDLDKNII